MMKSFALSHQGYYRTHNEDAYLEQADEGIFVIADGIGSLANGEWASQILAEPFMLNVHKQGFFHDRVYAFRRELIRRHQHLFYAQQDMMCGATVVALVTDRHKAMILWAGDARAYCYHQKTRQLIQLTHDHAFKSAVTRAAGVEQVLVLDEKILDLQGDELLLLCSDGLSKSITQEGLADILSQSLPLSTLCTKLIDHSLAHGSQDNITALLVQPC